MTGTYGTIKDVAGHFKVSVSTVRVWVRSNVIAPESYIKIKKAYRFDMDKVEADLRAASTAADGDTPPTGRRVPAFDVSQYNQPPKENDT